MQTQLSHIRRSVLMEIHTGTVYMQENDFVDCMTHPVTHLFRMHRCIWTVANGKKSPSHWRDAHCI